MILGLRTIKFGIKSLYRKAKRIVLGQPILASKEVAEHRRQLCWKCPFRAGQQCVICTCNIQLKTMFTDEFCPQENPQW